MILQIDYRIETSHRDLRFLDAMFEGFFTDILQDQAVFIPQLIVNM